jgi:hypothetical protein
MKKFIGKIWVGYITIGGVLGFIKFASYVWAGIWGRRRALSSSPASPRS